MANILLLGAGFVTGPLVDYLHKKEHTITIGSQFLSEAEKLAAGRSHLFPIQVDVTNDDELANLAAKADLVISFVPFQFHVAVARICIAQKVPLVTASYAHQDMWALNEAAKEADIILLNEIGVDPGIDHMTAMKVIHEAHDKKQKVEALVSWCGGIPAPEANNNPLGYKFSWSPMAVLTAVLNEAKYYSRGKVETIAAKDLLSSMRDVPFNEELQLTGYANRDSLGYREAYEIPEVQTLLRGTLRYPGFAAIIHKAKAIGLLSNTLFNDAKPSNWRELIAQLSDLSLDQLESSFDSDPELVENFAWMDCFSDRAVAGRSPIEAFCALLQDKLQYEENEQDMIAMQHRFVLTDENNNKIFHRSTLVEKGDVGGFSAMAKTVGYPAAIAADLILKGQITRKGVCIPVTQDIYEPVLQELEKLNIKMVEEIVNDESEASFLNHL
ncbi:saccharopine dehydrogenase C-terminal domain-containing protein [Aliikangiella maris]|uniref:Saccharopine dehydrogenase C-terminal domain-containing protein n=2 Tax=Aliikangiella maris TaxID=3162458 RepID=A0ABV3MJY7_9GAMM